MTQPFARANALVETGQLAEALGELDAAAALFRSQGQPPDEARCLNFAAALCRLLGRLDAAQARADRALALAAPRSPEALAATIEQAEVAFARGEAARAAERFAAALGIGGANLTDGARATLLRRRAQALAGAAAYRAAADDLARAHELLERAGEREAALRTQIERATALHEAGEPNDAERALQQATSEAHALSDKLALADIALLRSARAVAHNQPDAARALAHEARQHALEAVAPAQYISAAVAIAHLSDALGDRVAAYEALAVGWATLGDLLGREAGRAAFEPPLLALRERWGAAAFADVKAAYAARRRSR